MDLEAFTQDLQEVRARGDRFAQRAAEAVEGEALLPEALEELSTALEELRVTEEELRVQHEQLAEGRQRLEAERDHYRELFQLAPVAYLVTDPMGVIREVNRRAASLLGVTRHFLVGRPLAMFVTGQHRWGLRDRLNRLGSLEDPGSWQLRLQPRRPDPVAVVVSTTVARDQAGRATGLRWALLELPPASDQAAQDISGQGAAPAPLLAELLTSRPAGPPTLTAVPRAAPDWDNLAETLQQVVRTAMPLLRTDGAGLMLADADGALHRVTGTDPAEQALEQAQRDLGEGPCIDAFRTGQVVATEDLRADPRWPRLSPAARTNQIGGGAVGPGPPRRPGRWQLQCLGHRPPDLDRERRQCHPGLCRAAQPTAGIGRRRPPPGRAGRPTPVRPGVPSADRAGQRGPHGTPRPGRPGGPHSPAPAGPVQLPQTHRRRPRDHHRPQPVTPTGRPAANGDRWAHGP